MSFESCGLLTPLAHVVVPWLRERYRDKPVASKRKTMYQPVVADGESLGSYSLIHGTRVFEPAPSRPSTSKECFSAISLRSPGMTLRMRTPRFRISTVFSGPQCFCNGNTEEK